MAKPSSAKTRRRTNKVRRTQSRRGGGKGPNDSFLHAFTKPYNASSEDRGFFFPSSSSSSMAYTPSSPLARALKHIEKAVIRDIVASEMKLKKKQITLAEHDENVVRITQLAEEKKRAARRSAGQSTIRDKIHGVKTSVSNLRTSAATSARNALNAIRNSDVVSNAFYVGERLGGWDHTPIDDDKPVKGLFVNRGL